MSTLAERLTRTGEAVLDLAAAMPPDTSVIELHATGYDYGTRSDVKVQLGSLPDALLVIAALGGVWPHHLHQPSGGKVHHRWEGTFQGWSVVLSAIWSADDIDPVAVVPMVEQLPPVTHHWEDEKDRAWKARELVEHPEAAGRLDDAIDTVHRLVLAGVVS